MSTTVLLNNGRVVHSDMLKLVRIVVEDRVPSLPHSAKFTLKKIFGEGLWGELNPGEQRTAGLCMSHMVTAGELPFVVAESKHEYPVYYQLK